MEILVNLGLALALGLLVGVERGWQEREAAEAAAWPAFELLA